MSRLDFKTKDRAQVVVEGLYQDLERRIVASPPGQCPVDMAESFLKLCHAQSCGKCVPCRVGIGQLVKILDDILDLNKEKSMEQLELLRRTAVVIKESADCAIGTEAASMVLRGLDGFREDYEEHILHNRCATSIQEGKQPVPCVALCPAGVDVPGYTALVMAGRYDDAVRLIRKDNPFPTVCAHICEHPCEARCRRQLIDTAVNIRGIKRYAVDHCSETVPVPAAMDDTGKKVAIIGGGPGGLSAAYFLAIMGHKPTIFEKRSKLGGMLRYGIPNYRLPRERLQWDIEEILRGIGDDSMPDFNNKAVVVIGGGNVAMDVARTAKRLGASEVKIVYRRRKQDMTALPEEIDGAVAEGCTLVELKAPAKIESNSTGSVRALWVQPQIAGEADKSGRPRPTPASAPEERIPCHIIISAIGQSIESQGFEKYGIPVVRGSIVAESSSAVSNVEGFFAGGDCVTGPSTVINAIAAGKVAAANIDEHLGYHHEISEDIEIPYPKLMDKKPCGRAELKLRYAKERGNDFMEIEYGMSHEEALQEASRCLRCDFNGFGAFRGGRTHKW